MRSGREEQHVVARTELRIWPDEQMRPIVQRKGRDHWNRKRAQLARLAARLVQIVVVVLPDMVDAEVRHEVQAAPAFAYDLGIRPELSADQRQLRAQLDAIGEPD